MAKFIDKLKEVGKDMGRVIKEDPANTVLDVVMAVLVGGYIFLSRMSGYYQGRIDMGNDIMEEFKNLDWKELDEPENGAKGGESE